MVVRKRLDITGSALVFITTTVRDWTPIFNNSDMATAGLAQLEETTSHHNVTIAGYVVMPTHLHLLLGFEQIERMSSVMQTFKSLSSRRLYKIMSNEAKGLLGGSGSRTVWKPRFDDLVIWSERHFKIKLDYIHNNSVRAGLVDTATEYPYSSARCWLLDTKGLIEVDKEWSWT